jgi:translation initiation factor IF-2
LATVLVHDGTLRLSDTVVVGNTWGKVKAVFNDTGRRLRRARPSTPVVILGLHSVPKAGDTLSSVSGERQARVLAEQHLEETATPKSVSLTNLYDQLSTGRITKLNIVLKADVEGSLEPIKASLGRLGSDEVQVSIIHSSSGNVTESDVMLAIASQGLIVAFNTKVETGAQRLAETEGIDIRHYNVIYDLANNVEKALKGLLEPEIIEVIEGRAEVRAIFTSKKNKIAGVYVTEGKVIREVATRVLRKDETIVESTVNSLRRFKDNVREVTAGYECGISLKDFNDFEVGDILEFFKKEKAG